jgi:hypothetical protein
VEATWPNATYINVPATGKELVEMVSAGVLRGKVELHLKGTNLQVCVWRALLGVYLPVRPRVMARWQTHLDILVPPAR